mgnify:FL=1
MGQIGNGGGGGGECLTMNEKLSCVGGEVKHENLVSSELTRVKHPSLLKFGALALGANFIRSNEGLTSESSAWLSFYGGYFSLFNFFETKNIPVN